MSAGIFNKDFRAMFERLNTCSMVLAFLLSSYTSNILYAWNDEKCPLVRATLYLILLMHYGSILEGLIDRCGGLFLSDTIQICLAILSIIIHLCMLAVLLITKELSRAYPH